MMPLNVERDLMELNLEPRRRDHGKNGLEARCECPFCPRGPTDARTEPALEVNIESGLWHCWRCQERGNMFTLRRRLRGEPVVYHAARRAKPKPPPGRTVDMAEVERKHASLFTPQGARALEYLRGRGFTEATLRSFKTGFESRPKLTAISLPYLSRDGTKCLGVKYRVLPPDDELRKYEREAGCVMPLFNWPALDGECRQVVVTEGELDAMALTQYDLGVPVVSIPDGATAALKDEAADALLAFDEILLATDQDEKGEEGAAKLAEALGAFRCQRVRLPKKDANECLQAGVPREDLAAALAAATAYGVAGVRHVSEWRDALLSEANPQVRGVDTGWLGLTEILGGIRPAEMSLLTAETGNGKSTFTLALAVKQAERGRAVMIACLEMATAAVARKLLCAVAGKRWDRLEREENKEAVNRLCGLPVYLLDHYGDISIPRLRDEVTYAVRRFGVSLVVIDHLHFALGVRRAGEDERLLIDQTAHAIHAMALELGVHVLLVMHPAKIRADDKGHARLPEIGDLKGSSGPAQFADNVLRIAREPSAKLGHERAIVSALKVRSELGRLGSVVFAFDADALRFTELDSPAMEKRRECRDYKKAAAGDRD